MGNITRAETAKILTIIAAVYPKFEITELKQELWFDMLGDLSFKLVQVSVKKVMLTSEFAPTIANVRKAAADIATSSNEILDAGKAWGEVVKAIKKYGWPEPEKAYAMMSPFTLDVVKKIGWREICSCDAPDVIRGQFIRLYEFVKQKEQEDRKLPGSFKKQIHQISAQISMVKNNDKLEERKKIEG